MRAKLKTECGEFHFMWKLAAQMILSVMAAYAHLSGLMRSYPEACLGEYIVYSLTNLYYFLALFPFLCLMWTSGRNNETHRYPVLIRYRTRKESLCIRLLAKIFFLLAALAIHIGALLAVGHSLPRVSGFVYVTAENPAGVIVRQLLNIFCYVCVMYLLHEILRGIVGNVMLDTMFTTLAAFLDLVATKLMLGFVAAWTPWGHIAYVLFGSERKDYRFYWLYWLFLLLFLFYIADLLNGRKDYVFEETRKVN